MRKVSILFLFFFFLSFSYTHAQKAKNFNKPKNFPLPPLPSAAPPPLPPPPPPPPSPPPTPVTPVLVNATYVVFVGNSTRPALTKDVAVNPENGASYVTGDTGSELFVPENTQQRAGGYIFASFDPSGEMVCGTQNRPDMSGSVIGLTIKRDTQGFLYILGSTSSPFPNQTEHGYVDYFIAKYTSTCQLLWLKEFGITGTTLVAGLHPEMDMDQENNLYLAGFLKNGTEFANVNVSLGYFVAKHNSHGELLWRTLVWPTAAENCSSDANFYYGNEMWALAYDAIHCRVYVGGSQRCGFSLEAIGSAQYPYGLFQFDAITGMRGWSVHGNISSVASNNAYAVVVDNLGDIYVGGKSWLVKYDYHGHVLWFKNTTGSGFLSLDRGTNHLYAGLGSSYITEYDPSGNVLSWREYAVSHTTIQSSTMDNADAWYVVGTISRNGLLFKVPKV